MNTRTSILAIAALAATAVSLVASPALAGHSFTSARSVGHINLASSFTTPSPSRNDGHRLRNITVGRVPPPSCPGGCLKKNVGQGDTIDVAPLGIDWGEYNGNLPGKGAMGN